MLYSLRVFDRSEVAQQRMKIIKFYEGFGEKATKEAFGAVKKLLADGERGLRKSVTKIFSLPSPLPSTISFYVNFKRIIFFEIALFLAQ